MPIPRCLVEAPWERPEPEHAVLAVKAPRIARGRVDPERAAAAVSDAEADAKLFREFTKAAVATRSAAMDAFCKERLAKGQTWNARGLVHVMSDDAAF